jgi:hypothetical protein
MAAHTPQDPERPAPSLSAIMLLTVGAALGFWLVTPDLRALSGGQHDEPHLRTWDQAGFYLAVALLGGISLVGVPLLLGESRRRRVRWGPGKFLWFTQGVAGWLLWPPILATRWLPAQNGDSTAKICYYYGTPLMAVFVGLALLAGGRFRRRWRRVFPPSWRERFGLLLGCLWVLVGVYLLLLIYRSDILV